MKNIIKKRVIPPVLCLTLIASHALMEPGVASLQGEAPSSQALSIVTWATKSAFQQPDEDPRVRVASSQVLPNRVAVSRLAALSKADEEIQTLSKHLTEQGYRARTAPANHFGWDVTYRLPDGQTAKVTILIQDYTKEGSRDTAAVGTMTITARSRSNTYTFSLVAPGGDFRDAIESTVDKRSLNVLRANSLWSCFVNRVNSKCTGTCIAALGTCLTSGVTWAAYLGCLAVKCGACAAKAFGCCLCDCSWWCRWAVGCCHR